LSALPELLDPALDVVGGGRDGGGGFNGGPEMGRVDLAVTSVKGAGSDYTKAGSSDDQ
jgi:hypothetical protein